MTDVPSGQPSDHPSAQPSSQPSAQPSYQPSAYPSYQPSGYPSAYPSYQPSGYPSRYPSYQPSGYPSVYPSYQPSGYPSAYPSYQPSGYPSAYPSYQPSGYPSYQPSGYPSWQPSYQPSGYPSFQPSGVPSGRPSGQPPVIPGGPSGAPAAELVLSNLKAAATARHLRLDVDIQNPSTRTFAAGSVFFEVVVTPTGEGAQANVVRRASLQAITPGLSTHVVEVEQLDPGDYDVLVSVGDASGTPVSNTLTTTVHEAGRPTHAGTHEPGQAVDVSLAITRVEHVSGIEYRTHYTLRNHGHQAIPPGLEVDIDGVEPAGGSASEMYNLQSAVPPGGSQEHYLTLMLAHNTAWTITVTAGAAKDEWKVNIDNAGSVQRAN